MLMNPPFPHTAMQALQSRFHSSPTLSVGEPLAVDHRPSSMPHHSWLRLHPTSEILYPHGQTFGNAVPDYSRKICIAEPGARGAGGDPKDLIP